MTTNTTAPTITIIKTSQRGALLITDGIRVAWVMGRSHRADGSFTPAAISALSVGKTYAEWEAEDIAWRASRAKEQEERERAFQDGKLPTTITLPASLVFDGSDKAWKVRDGKQWNYGKLCNHYQYLPKSMVSVEWCGDDAILTMPKWYLAKNGWLNQYAR